MLRIAISMPASKPPLAALPHTPSAAPGGRLRSPGGGTRGAPASRRFLAHDLAPRPLPRRSAEFAKSGRSTRGAPAARRITNRRRLWLGTRDCHAGNPGMTAAVAVGLATQGRVEQILDKRCRLRREIHLPEVRPGPHRHTELQLRLSTSIFGGLSAAPVPPPRRGANPGPPNVVVPTLTSSMVDVELMRLTVDALESAACAALFGRIEQVVAIAGSNTAAPSPPPDPSR